MMDVRIPVIGVLAVVLVILGASILPTAIENGKVDTVPLRYDIVIGDKIVYEEHISTTPEYVLTITYTVIDILENGQYRLSVEGREPFPFTIDLDSQAFRELLTVTEATSILRGVETISTAFGELRCAKYYTMIDSTQSTSYCDYRGLVLHKEQYNPESGLTMITDLVFISMYLGDGGE